jgi:hypothetical protein
VVFARTWRQTPVGRAIHQMFEIPGYGNYCELAYQLFLLRMEAVDLAEKDKLLAEELAEMRKKENDIKREVEVAEETFVEMLLRGELKEIAELKKEVHSRLNARYCENESGCSQKVSQREKYCFFHNKSCPAVACRERMSNS